MGRPLTIWEHARLQGHSRRDFLKFCAWLTAAAGMESSAIAQVVKALETKPGCRWSGSLPGVHLLQRVVHPLVAPDRRRHHPRQALARLHADAAGRRGRSGREGLHDTMAKYPGEYLMLVEGSIPTGADGVYCCIAGRTALDIVKEAAAGAKAIVAWGSCASNGCIQAAAPNPTGATPVHKIITGKPIIKVPGLPAHRRGDGRHDRAPAGLRHASPSSMRSAGPRPSTRVACTTPATAGPTTTPGCSSSRSTTRTRGGLLPLQDGLPRADTYNACAVTMRWNNGVSFPIQSGHGCIGCSEANFWDNGAVLPAAAEFPGLRHRDHRRQIGLAVGAATRGLGAHAVLTNVRKRDGIAGHETAEPKPQE
jgi:hydrogenase small subunit